MTPRKLRAFRESLRMSRCVFARKLLISEPTLERWERGAGGPRELHLRILSRMREHVGAGHSMPDFSYDAADDATVDPSQEPRQLIIDVFRSQGVILLAARGPDRRGNWSLRFHPGWAGSEPAKLSLHCEGSDAPLKPAIDFTLKVGAKAANAAKVSGALQTSAFDHCLSWKIMQRSTRTTIELRQRIFTTGCNSDTLKHVLGNHRSCLSKLQKALLG